MIIGNPIMAGVSGPAASIFVTGLSETDTVTATNGSKTLTGKWKSDPNPEFVSLPSGYTQLEYIESTGTQYIDTNYISTLNCESVAIDSEILGIYGGSNSCLYGGYDPNNNNMRSLLLGIMETTSISIQAGETYLDPVSFLSGRHTFSASANNGVLNAKIDNTSIVSSISYTGTVANNTSRYLLCANVKNSTPDSSRLIAKLYSAKIYSDSEYSVPVRKFIPAKRNSDGAVGLYDFITKAFFENAGTGTFIAGPETPQTIDGFLIKPIRDFGTWTVTATDGVHTKTQDVLVDVITEYEIEMSYKLWLYRDGDECEDVTGGWSSNKAGNATFTEENNCLVAYGGSNSGAYGKFYTVNLIDVSNFEKLKITIQNCTVSNDSSFFGLSANTNIHANFNENVEIAYKYMQNAGTYEIDISNIGGSYYVCFGSGNLGRKAYATKIWLE